MAADLPNPVVPTALTAKYQRLVSSIAQSKRALVCFSGGVDSALLLKAAVDALGANAIALTAISPSLPRRELAEAETLARRLGARHLLRDTLEVQNSEYAANPTNRCYFCKGELMRVAKQVAAKERVEAILLGTNADELTGHRPGLKAANEAQARHPLAEAELSKAEIRLLSHHFGLPTWDKPQMACLASRFPYGTQITPERLDRIERFEAALADIGFRGLRVRFHDAIARIELDPAQMGRALEQRTAIVDIGRSLGFSYTTLDLVGYRTGALNETVVNETAPDAQQVRIALAQPKSKASVRS
ncbi:MAG: ATP-dependent sacrificial sulfur transferase LarE [Deltaproteobacteria bacterium]|nr:ATP-dependent sacrificial sulfur transferase LarE [Deltaproteobacteria bacterium]